MNEADSIRLQSKLLFWGEGGQFVVGKNKFQCTLRSKEPRVAGFYFCV